MVFVQAPADRIQNLADHLAPVAARNLDCLEQHRVARGVQVFEAEVFQFLINVVQPQTVGDRRVDVQCLAGDALALVARHRAQRAHVVQAVGQLDQDDANIARHRQQHLAEIFRLRIFAGLEFDLVQLAEAVHQFGHRLAELFGYLFIGDMGVFHHIVQQGRHDRLGIEMQLEPGWMRRRRDGKCRVRRTGGSGLDARLR